MSLTEADYAAAFNEGYEEATTWKTIETAPKDGTLILVAGQRCRPTAGRFVKNHKSMGGFGYCGPADKYQEWCDRPGSDGWLPEGEGTIADVTHWQPIPKFTP